MKVRTCNKSRAEAAVGIMMSHERYLVPPALGCDRTFLHDARDAGYVELASAMLFDRAGHGDIGELFPMAMLPAWWQFPLPTTFDVPIRVGHGVRQVFHAPVTHEEWLMYHNRFCPSSTVSRGRSRFIDLNPDMGEFGRSPGGLDGVRFCRNVFLPLPPSHRYFAVCSGSPSTRAHVTGLSLAGFERLAAAEWILYFGVAYFHKICISRAAMVLSDEAIAVMKGYAGAFSPLPIDLTFSGVWPRSAVVWDDILRFARLVRSAPMDSRFLRRYSVMKADEWAVTLDPADGEVLNAVEFNDRYNHLAYGSRTGLQSEAERRGADAGGRRADGRESGRRNDRTDVLGMQISRSEFLAFGGSEGRAIL